MLVLIIVVLTAIIDVVTSQAMSVSLVSNSSQLFCYTPPPPSTSPLMCALSEQYLTAPRSFASRDKLIIAVFNLTSKSNLSILRPLLVSSSGSFVCALRKDHSVVCADVLDNSTSSSSSLALYCPSSASATYECGRGRAGSDGVGWIGSANGNSLVTAETATGFSFISVTAVNSSSIGLYLLTAEPEQYPTFYGPSSMHWNYSLNPDQYTDRYCLSPMVNQTTFNDIAFTRVTAAAPWSPRHDATTLVYPHKIEFTDTNGSNMVLPRHSLVTITARTIQPRLAGNDVWVSADHGMSNWTTAINACMRSFAVSHISWYIICGISTSNQRAFGEFAYTSFAPLFKPTTIYKQTSGVVWLVAGSIEFVDQPTNQVWTSSDMVHWRSISTSETMFTPRTFAAGGMDRNGTMYLVSGLAVNNRRLNDVWCSTDGVKWDLIIARAAFSERQEAQVSVVPSTALSADILVLVGGYTGLAWLSDVWLSNNGGFTWLRVTQSAQFPVRAGFVMGLSPSNVLFMALGSNRADFWVSFDGSINWYQCVDRLPMGIRGWSSIVFDVNNHILVLGGLSTSEPEIDTNDIWRSTLSFNDTLSLAMHCGNNIVVPIHPGLQCWPTTSSSSCPNITSITVVHADPMRFVPLRRHIRLRSLLHTTMQSVCGDADKACGLTMNGTILCWHSVAVDDAPITISPPAYLNFTQLTCGFAPDSTSMTYACAITSNVGMAGRVICWTVSGSISDTLYVDGLTYWMYTEMFQLMDIVLQQQLLNEWARDISLSGQVQCSAFSPPQPLPFVMDQVAYNTRAESSVIRQITNHFFFKSISCVHWSEWCSLISADDQLVRVKHRFTSGINIFNMTPKNDSVAVQVVALKNSVFTTTVSVRQNNAESILLFLDETLTPSVSGDWSYLLRENYSELFIDAGMNISCGIQHYPIMGQVRCSNSLQFRFVQETLLRQVTFGYFALANSVSPTSGLCAQRLNDSRWQCYPSPLPGELNAVTANKIVPVSTGIINRQLQVITAHAPWNARSKPVMQLYPRSLTFNNQSNGALIVLPPNSLVMTMYDAVEPYDRDHLNVRNDVWTSGDGGETWFLIAGITDSGVCAFGEAANSSFIPQSSASSIVNKTSGQVWILAGAEWASGSPTNRVWTSTDMIHWTTYIAAFKPRYGAVSAIDSNGFMFIGAGGVYGYFDSDFWVSRNAINWTVTCSPCVFGMRMYAQLSITYSQVLNLDMLVLIGGDPAWAGDPYYNDIWTSSDAADSWICITMSAPFLGRNRFVLDVTASNALILSFGQYIDAPSRKLSTLNDVFLSFDGAVTWYQCADMVIDGRHSTGWIFNSEDYLLLFGGVDSNDFGYRDVWRSSIRFNDSVLMARWCIDVNSPATIMVPKTPGLQCWPPSAACNNVTYVTLNSSDAFVNEYSLVLALLDAEETAHMDSSVVDAVTTPSNLYVWSSSLAEGQSNNYMLRWSTADVTTVFSSTSWSPLLVTKQPRSMTRYTHIASTYDYACALITNGSVRCWGSDKWFVAWPRCSGTVCLMYGNLCVSSSDCTNSIDTADTSRAYFTSNPPSHYEPYTDFCVTGAYACAISNSSIANGSVICWMGIYGSGSPMVRWTDTVARYGRCSVRANGVSICAAPMMNDTNAFKTERFSSIQCSQFSVCGLTINGSILCSSLPIRYEQTSADMIIRRNDVPFVRIGQSNSNELCGILVNGSIRCNPSSTSQLRTDRPEAYGGSFAPQHAYRIGGGTYLKSCYGGAYSDRRGSITALCSGPCSAGFTGVTPFMNNNSTNPECRQQCTAGSWCPQGAMYQQPCSYGTYGSSVGLMKSSECSFCTVLGQYCPEGATAPLLCPRGTYCPTSTEYIPCRAGRYGDSFGLSDPECSGECDAGFICTTFSVTPKQQPCPSGQYSNDSGKSECLDCTPGTYAKFNINGTRECIQCLAGEYASVPGSSTCLECLPGHYTSETGQALCQRCLPGSYASNPAAQECLSCPAGHYSSTNASSLCIPCAPGHYSDKPAQTFCRQCLAGKFANDTGAGVCVDCLAGQYSPTVGSSICTPCPLGQYNAQKGRPECISCPAGTASENLITGDTRCIPCAVGLHSPTPGNHVCIPCAAGTYNLLNRSDTCYSCSSIAGVNCQSGIAFIDEGYHGSVVISRSSSGMMNVSLITQPCPNGYCVGGSSADLDVSVIDEYLSSGRNDTIYMSLLNQCSDNRAGSSSSPLCGICKAGYAPSEVGSPYVGCVSCNGISWLKVSLLIGVSWLFVVIYYVAANGRLGLIGVLLYYLQTIAIMVTSQSSLTAWLRTFFSPISIMPRDCLAPMSPELQYALPLFICPLQMMQLLIVVLLHAVLKRYGSSSAYTLDPHTMTYMMTSQEHLRYSREVSSLSIRWFIVLIRYRLWPELTVSTVCRAIFLIIMASFTSTLLTCISWFQCTDDIALGLSRASGSVVFVFPAISCQMSSAHYAWSAVMLGIIIIWSIFMVLMLWWTVTHYYQLALLQKRHAFSRQEGQFELRVLVPMALTPHISEKKEKSGLLSVPFFDSTNFSWYYPPAVRQADGDDSLVHTEDNYAEPMETRREYAFRSLYGALFDSFAPNATCWTLIILVRRLLLILLSVALATTPSIKFMSFVFLHVIIGIGHAYYHPYALPFLNEIETIAILVHMTVAVLLLTTASNPNDSTIQSAILAIVIVPFVTYLSLHFGRTWLRSGAKADWNGWRDHVGASVNLVPSLNSSNTNAITSPSNLKTRLLHEDIELEYKNKF